MQKWEYCELYSPPERRVFIISKSAGGSETIEDPEANIVSVMAQLGEEGWEAFSHIRTNEGVFEVLLKRPLQD